MITFIEWLADLAFKHQYWAKEPGKLWQTDKWGKVNIERSLTTGQSVAYRTYGHPVTKKKCKVCGRTIWSNNPDKICASLKCWNERRKN